MFSKPKNFASPSDAQANEKLALYVYEYLVYSGAQKAAQTFLQEIGWEKNIIPNEAPGFLYSWWSVFWDLYCAAPERRDVLKHSPDARAFYDYGLASPGFGPGCSQMNLGMPYLQGRNGPQPPMQAQQPQQPQQQFMPRPMYPGGMAKMSGMFPVTAGMGDQQQQPQHLEAFLSPNQNGPPPPAATFRPTNSSIPSLPIASAPTVTLRHQPRPPMGAGPRPMMTNGNAPAPPGSPNGDFLHHQLQQQQQQQQDQQQQQFGRQMQFQQQQRSMALKIGQPNGMVPMRPQQGQQQWGMGMGQPPPPPLQQQQQVPPPPIDFLTGNAKISPIDGSSVPPPMPLFEPSLMDTLPPQPQPQQQQKASSSVAADDTSGFFDQSDALGGVVREEVCAEPVTQSQISQLLSPSPVNNANQQQQLQPQQQQAPATQSHEPTPPPKPRSIEEALLLEAPDLDLLAGEVECALNGTGAGDVLFPEEKPPPVFETPGVEEEEEGSVEMTCPPLKDIEVSKATAALFMQE